jgi:hypothetical protein
MSRQWRRPASTSPPTTSTGTGPSRPTLQAKGRVYARTQVACIYNVDDPLTEQLVDRRRRQEGCRAIGFTLGVPAPSMVGLVEDVLADRAFVEQRRTSAAELATLDDLRGEAPTAHRTMSPTPWRQPRWRAPTGWADVGA